EQNASGREHAIGRILIEILLPAVGFGLGVGFATQDYPASLITGLAISGAIYILDRLDRALLRPRLEAVTRDWLKIGMEMTFLLLEHVVGATLALLVCSLLFGFQVVPSAAWIALAGVVIAFPIIHGTQTALRYYRRLQDKERQEEQLRALTTQAELRALKAQVNPHFLFNTLNTIAQLIHTDPARAEATIERLAEMFRYILAGSERGMVPLGEELAFVDRYLEIEQARFGQRLRVDRQVAPQILNIPVPSLILQPLVENAVRHGQGPDGRVDVTIRVQREDSQVTIAIADQGPGMPSNHAIGQGSGFGLCNVDQRLRKTYGEAYGLEIGDNEPKGTVVRVRIPL
ncbi:MAG: sensor histidine kinase, partial [Anaerolineae bacterium]